MSDKLTNFVKDSSLNAKRAANHHTLFGTVDMYIIDPLPANINILAVIDRVEDIIPAHIAQRTEGIYVGNFKEFEEKQVNAMYRDGTIYVSNDQDDDEDMIDDIIHEFAHAAEEIYAREIYEDNKIQTEFLGKRKRLKDLLDQYDYLGDTDVSFSDLEFTKELDDFLYNDIGYDKLENFCMGLFARPYAATSIREYFATAFEECLLGDGDYVKKLSPMAYKKVMLVCSDEV